MKWQREYLYVRRDSRGAIIDIRESRPVNLSIKQENVSNKATRSSSDVKGVTDK